MKPGPKSLINKVELERVLLATGSVAQTAQILGISRQWADKWRQRLGIELRRVASKRTNFVNEPRG